MDATLKLLCYDLANRTYDLARRPSSAYLTIGRNAIVTHIRLACLNGTPRQRREIGRLLRSDLKRIRVMHGAPSTPSTRSTPSTTTA